MKSILLYRILFNQISLVLNKELLLTKIRYVRIELGNFVWVNGL